MQRISSQDRSAIIRLASSLPSGSPEKKAILSGLAKLASLVRAADVETFWVAPMGPVSLKDGKNRSFNFLDVWGGDKRTLTLAKSLENQKMVLIVGASFNPLGHGKTIELRAERRVLGLYTVVADIPGIMSLDLLAEAAKLSGARSLPAYSLK